MKKIFVFLGCFGNSPYDRWMENQLYRWLDDQENDYYECENGDWDGYADDWDYDEEKNELICPKCKRTIKL